MGCAASVPKHHVESKAVTAPPAPRLTAEKTLLVKPIMKQNWFAEEIAGDGASIAKMTQEAEQSAGDGASIANMSQEVEQSAGDRAGIANMPQKAHQSAEDGAGMVQMSNDDLGQLVRALHRGVQLGRDKQRPTIGDPPSTTVQLAPVVITGSDGPSKHLNPIKIQVILMGGETHIVEMLPSSSLSDLKAEIHMQLGHSPGTQKLLLGAATLLDGNASLKDLGFVNNSALTLITCEPLGQSVYDAAKGRKIAIDQKGIPSDVLNEFELQSWQAACEGDREHDGIWDCTDDPWGNVGCGGLSFYWTSGSDGCRYEYWSSAPADKQYGILICVDSGRMRAIGKGSDDGLCLFKEFAEEFDNNEAFNQLQKHGWPCFSSKESDGEEGEGDE